MSKFIKPSPKSIIYEDCNLYVCLAKYPIAKGHTIAAWKKESPDLSLMPDRDYDYLMDTVFAARNSLLKTLKIEKVYLLYMDEANHVHWHLIPRYSERGFDAFRNKPEVLDDFSLVKKLRKNLVFK